MFWIMQLNRQNTSSLLQVASPPHSPKPTSNGKVKTEGMRRLSLVLLLLPLNARAFSPPQLPFKELSL